METVHNCRIASRGWAGRDGFRVALIRKVLRCKKHCSQWYSSIKEFSSWKSLLYSKYNVKFYLEKGTSTCWTVCVCDVALIPAFSSVKADALAILWWNMSIGHLFCEFPGCECYFFIIKVNAVSLKSVWTKMKEDGESSLLSLKLVLRLQQLNKECFKKFCQSKFDRLPEILQLPSSSTIFSWELE